MADDELLDVFDERGWHAGIKRRDEVHRDGDWHLAFHLWVVRADGVLLQRRTMTKDSWPGCLDATAAGHLLAGEAVRDGLREAEEELGVAYAFEDLTPFGVHRVDEQANRELQHVFGVRDERPLEAWTDFDRVEVDGLVLVDHDGFATLTGARGARNGDGPVPMRTWDGERTAEGVVARDELVPAPYLGDLAPLLRRLGGHDLAQH
jgi:isopentenyldiphosphate isomerase